MCVRQPKVGFLGGGEPSYMCEPSHLQMWYLIACGVGCPALAKQCLQLQHTLDNKNAELYIIELLMQEQLRRLERISLADFVGYPRLHNYLLLGDGGNPGLKAKVLRYLPSAFLYISKNCRCGTSDQ